MSLLSSLFSVFLLGLCISIIEFMTVEFGTISKTYKLIKNSIKNNKKIHLYMIINSIIFDLEYTFVLICCIMLSYPFFKGIFNP